MQEDVDENPYHKLHLEGHDHAVRALAARGRMLVSGSYDCTVRIWDIVTGDSKWILVGHTQKGKHLYKFTITPHSYFVIIQSTAWFLILLEVRLARARWTRQFAFGTF